MEPIALKTPQAGSPLISPDLIFFYFAVFILIVGLTYSLIHYFKKPQNPNHFKNLLFLSFGLKILIMVAIFAVSAFYFLPTPNVSKSSPGVSAVDVSTTAKIEIQFDKPVSRSNLVKKISPEAPGVWQFELGLYKTHFYRKLVFYPDVTLIPDTEYKVELENIKNASNLSDSGSYSFSFKTIPLPKVIGTNPQEFSHNVDLDREIQVKLDKPNHQLANFDFLISPEHEFEVSESPDKTEYTLSPKQKYHQGTTYEIKIFKNSIQYNSSGKIVYRGNSTEDYKTSFTTKLPPQISSFYPSGEQVLPNSEFEIEFTKPVLRFSAANNFSVTNGAKGRIIWHSDKKLTYIADNLKYDTNYEIEFKKGIISYDGSVLENDISLGFKTIGPVKLLASTSLAQDIDIGVDVNNILRFDFNQEVDRSSAQKNFSILPAVEGGFSWDKNTMIFTPNTKLKYDTHYVASFTPGIKSINGLDSSENFTLAFNTENFVFKLAVPVYLQKYSLSCEVASLNMILHFKGHKTNEDELLSAVGFDPTPNKNGTWGNPHEAFVGDVKGKQMYSGYGVYWKPIERVAKQYRDARSFSNWTLSQLTEEILIGNPVQVWVYSRGGNPVVWSTPEGTEIFAVSGEHSIIVKGFVGEKENPKQLIVNDPLIGEVYLPQEVFTHKWAVFDRSGVVVI